MIGVKNNQGKKILMFCKMIENEVGKTIKFVHIYLGTVDTYILENKIESILCVIFKLLWK